MMLCISLVIYVFSRSENSFSIRRAPIAGQREGQPGRDLRLPDQPAAVRLCSAAARAAAGAGPVNQRHGRPGQGGPPQLQGPRHRQQNGGQSLDFMILASHSSFSCFKQL